MIVYHGTTKKFDRFDLVHLGEGEGKSKVRRLLMELRDGVMECKLPEDWNKALVTIGGNE